MNRSHIRSMLTVVSLLVAAMVLGGCQLVGGAADERSVSDPDNLFHFKVPSEWQSSTAPGYLTVYAAEELPAQGDAVDALSLVVFTSKEPTATDETEMLDFLIDGRAEQRQWKSVEKGEPVPVEIGGVKGFSVDVTATNTEGSEFETRYYFVRASNAEVFLVAVAPDGTAIADYDDELEGITSKWFWQDDQGSAEATETERTP